MSFVMWCHSFYVCFFFVFFILFLFFFFWWKKWNWMKTKIVTTTITTTDDVKFFFWLTFEFSAIIMMMMMEIHYGIWKWWCEWRRVFFYLFVSNVDCLCGLYYKFHREFGSLNEWWTKKLLLWRLILFKFFFNKKNLLF